MRCTAPIVNGRRCRGGGGSPTPDAMTDLWEVDWSSVGSFDFLALGNGTYDVGGNDLRIQNVANASDFRITSGQGLFVVLNSTTAAWDSGATPTAPNPTYRLGDLVAPAMGDATGFDASVPWSFWWRFAELTIPTTNNAAIRCGVRGETGTGFSGVFAGIGPIRSTNERAVTACLNTAQNALITSEFSDPLTPGGPTRPPVEDWNVFVMRFLSNGTMQGFAGAHDGDGWPEWSDLNPVGFFNNGSTVQSTNLYLRPGLRVGLAPVSSLNASPGCQLLRQRITLG